jgi:hypothetical protein
VAIVAVSSPNDIDMNDDGFILQTSRNKKKRKGKFYAPAPELTEGQELERLLVILETKRKQVEEHREWWSQWRGVSAVTRVVDKNLALNERFHQLRPSGRR